MELSISEVYNKNRKLMIILFWLNFSFNLSEVFAYFLPVGQCFNSGKSNELWMLTFKADKWAILTWNSDILHSLYADFDFHMLHIYL